MAQRPPLTQLTDLCAGHGAVPTQIVKVAPFLESLAATRHAQEVLFPNGEADWSHAARQLLICVTEPGGVGGLDEKSSRFARACLGLNGSVDSFTERMNALANDPTYKYPTSPNTWAKTRMSVLSVLIGVLHQIDKYPCAPRPEKEKALDDAMALLAVIRLREYYSQDPEGLLEMRDDLFRRFARAYDLFDKHDPSFSPYQRLKVMVTAVAARTYREVFERLMPGSAELLVDPELVPRLFEDRPIPIDHELPAVERTAKILARIFRDIEERDAWEQAVIASAEADEGVFELSQSEMLRVRAYFEQFRDLS